MLLSYQPKSFGLNNNLKEIPSKETPVSSAQMPKVPPKQAGGLSSLLMNFSAPADLECLGLIGGDQKKRKKYESKFFLLK